MGDRFQRAATRAQPMVMLWFCTLYNMVIYSSSDVKVNVAMAAEGDPDKADSNTDGDDNYDASDVDEHAANDDDGDDDDDDDHHHHDDNVDVDDGAVVVAADDDDDDDDDGDGGYVQH